MAYCSLSGYFTQTPVILLTSGYVFDKKVIEIFIKEFNKCPITGISSNASNLLEFKSTQVVKPLFSNKENIFILLNYLQEEWTNNIINLYKMENNLVLTRQELVYSYYQNDAANKVIIRLMFEKSRLLKLVTLFKGIVKNISK